MFIEWSIADKADPNALIKEVQEILGRDYWVGSALSRDWRADPRMVVCGLVARPELNGTKGIICGYNEETGRHKMRLDTEEEVFINIRPANLFLVFPPARFYDLPVREGLVINYKTLGCSDVIAALIQNVFEHAGPIGWQDPRLGPDKPYLEIVGEKLLLRRVTTLSAEAQESIKESINNVLRAAPPRPANVGTILPRRARAERGVQYPLPERSI